MEKPSGRSTSANSKVPNSETKGKQESNKHSRGPKYKDNVYSRPEQTRRPIPQRNRVAHDKRPRSRGGYGTDRDRSEVTQTDKFGAGAAVKLGNKKLSLNHLLNFTITPPTASLSNDYRIGGWQAGRSHRKQKLPKYNKEQFLQANCQFIVKEQGDYTIHTTDPDILVDWELVEEIHLPSHEVPSCPICLYPPTAAKITRCGHIYCWSCLLHYLSLSDKLWRKCPICYEAIHKNDLKSVVSTSKAAYQVGDQITMCLMKRKRGSVIARPVYQSERSPSNSPLSLRDDANCFQKLLIASKEDVKGIIQREHNELKFQLEKEAETPESCFLLSALELLRERKELIFHGELMERDIFELLTINEKMGNSDCEEKCNNSQEKLIKETSSQRVEYMTDPFSDEDNEVTLCSSPDNSNDICTAAVMNTVNSSLQSSVPNASSDDIPNCSETLPPRINLGNTPMVQRQIRNQGKEFYYFYQAIDGQNIYLHSINVHMLVREFGSLEHCPHKFTAKVVELEGESMNEALRQRLRYLCHLPLTCEFQVAELGLCSPLIHESTNEAFKGELEKRSRTRRQKAKEEKRRERHIEQEENRKLGKFPGLNYHLDSLKHFPTCSQPIDIRNDHPPLPSNSVTGSPLSEYSFNTGLSSSAEQTPDQFLSEKTDAKVIQPTSFAQMLREGKMKQQTSQHSPTDNNITIGTASSDEDCNASAPQLRQSLGDAIEAALNNMNQPVAADNAENSTRKKKGKKMLLFTTCVNRRK